MSKPSSNRQARRDAKFGALKEAREQGCRCRARASVVENAEQGYGVVMEVEVVHQAKCPVRGKVKRATHA